MSISKKTVLGEIINNNPEVVPVLASAGLHCIGCHVSSYESLEEERVVINTSKRIPKKSCKIKIDKEIFAAAFSSNLLSIINFATIAVLVEKSIIPTINPNKKLCPSAKRIKRPKPVVNPMSIMAKPKIVEPAPKNSFKESSTPK